MEEKGLEFEKRDIFKEELTAEEIKDLHKKSGVSVDNFLNVKGKKFKELGLKDKLDSMTDEEKYQLMASDPMLIKRPFIESDKGFIFGFNKEEIDRLF